MYSQVKVSSNLHSSLHHSPQLKSFDLLRILHLDCKTISIWGTLGWGKAANSVSDNVTWLDHDCTKKWQDWEWKVACLVSPDCWREHSTWHPTVWRDTAVVSCEDTGWCGPGAAADWSTYLQPLLRTYLQQLQLMHPHKVIHLQEAATCIQTWERNKSGKMNSSQDAGRMVVTYWERNDKAKIIMAKIQEPRLNKDIERGGSTVARSTTPTHSSQHQGTTSLLHWRGLMHSRPTLLQHPHRCNSTRPSCPASHSP